MEGGLRGGPAQASAAVIQATQGAAELDLASLMRLAGAQHQLQALGVVGVKLWNRKCGRWGSFVKSVRG